MNSAFRAAVRRPRSAGAQVDLNKVATGHAAPRWTMRGKPSTAVAVGGGQSRPTSATLRSGPGPGEYATNAPEDYWDKRSPAFSFKVAGEGDRSATGLDRSTGPGPGDYDGDAAARRAVHKSTPQGTFGKERRETRSSSRRRSVGPGDYDVPQALASRRGARGITMSDKGLQLPIRETPGPADYVVPAPPRAGRGVAPYWGQPSAGFRSRTRGEETYGLKAAEGNPGPGHYEAVEAMLPRKPNFSIAQPREAWIEELHSSLRHGGPGVTYTQFAW